jgi:hypothetical protein
VPTPTGAAPLWICASDLDVGVERAEARRPVVTGLARGPRRAAQDHFVRSEAVPVDLPAAGGLPLDLRRPIASPSGGREIPRALCRRGEQGAAAEGARAGHRRLGAPLPHCDSVTVRTCRRGAARWAAERPCSWLSLVDQRPEAGDLLGKVGVVLVAHAVETRGERLAVASSEGGAAGAIIAAMTGERLPPGIPGPRRSLDCPHALAEQFRRMAVYLQTAAVLELQSRRCEPSPGSALLCECAHRRRMKAVQIRDGLAFQGVTLSRPSRSQ